MLLELPHNPAPVRSATASLSRANVGEDASASEDGRLLWSLSFLSFIGLELDQAFGTLAIVLFIAPWIMILAPKIRRLSAAVIRNWPLLMLPALAGFSVLWSRDPLWSLRVSLEFLITIVIGLAASNCVNRRTILNALMTALMVADSLGVFYILTHGQISLSGPGSEGHTGVFGSKNQFAGAASVQIILALCFLLYEKNNIRKIAWYSFVILIGLFSFYIGRSGGALVSLLISLLALSFVVLYKRSMFLAISIIFMAVFISGSILSQVGLTDLSSTALSSLGKDKTLTGRTDLWAIALKEIDDAPVIGEGYNAFWRQGNPKAERLWAEFHIPGRMGFHFHDTYLQISVDLGILGGLILVIVLVGALIKSIKRCSRSLNATEVSLIAIFAYFISWSIVEVEFIAPFDLSAIILCMCFYDGQKNLKVPERLF